jgi:type I restriction enzyme S subunit
MSSEWKNITLGELCKDQGGSIQTGPFGSQLHTSDYRMDGTPVVMPTNILGGCISEQGIARIGQADVERLSQHKLRLGDIVFSRRGDVTKNALVRSHEVGWLCGTGCLKVRVGDERTATSEFVSYLLQHPETKDWLTRHAVGVTMPNLNTGILSAVPLRIPSLKMQKQITEVLGSLDAMARAYAEQNATMESIAQAAFRSWFLRFDPVTASAAGRGAARLSEAMRDSLPDTLEDSPLGPIPSGWSASTVGEVFSINPKTLLKKGSLAPYFDMANAPLQGHRPLEAVGRREFQSGSKFQNGDTLLARITPCLENGKTAHVDFLRETEVGWGSTEFLVLRANDPRMNYIGYLLARHEPFRQFAIQTMTGSSGRQRVAADRLAQYPFVLPSDAFLSASERFFDDLRACIAANDSAMTLLQKLKETLLPRLVRGEHLSKAAEVACALAA